ncbi:MAG TPA: Shedu anti-phage system protein SduA domain-containing protein [Chloroflexia bacterium]|nr:Shedu anti-phage system protein SduA domain-containing protein [Chloroflexia bacterium]
MDYIDKSRVAELLAEKHPSEISKIIYELGESRTEEDLQSLENFLLVPIPVRSKRPFESREYADIPKHACLNFLAFGEAGIRRLAGLFPKVSERNYSVSILEIIYAISEGIYPSSWAGSGMRRAIPFTDELVLLANKVFNDFVIRSQTDITVFSDIVHLMNRRIATYTRLQRDPNDNVQELDAWISTRTTAIMQSVFDIIRKSSISLPMSIIEEYKTLVQSNLREEEYQSFLARHPVLLDPLARSVVSKQTLGSDFKTDFVISKLDGEYIVVEIEKPQDRIFVTDDNFSSSFSHAYGQVLDFQEWVEVNISYAQTQLPGIVSPRGMLIMGRRSELTDWQKRKLARFNTNNSGRVRVMCFDDIVESAYKLYKNMYRDIILAPI